MYSSNRNDCLQYILDSFKIAVKREPLPDGWQHQRNFLVEGIIKNISKIPKIHSIILNQKFLKKGDVVLMKFRGKYIHHLAKYIGENHIEHNLPGRGVCKDLLHKRFFVFGVRIWE